MRGCDSMSCYGGVSGPCIKNEGAWSHRKVTCATVDFSASSENEVFEHQAGVGEYGGTCTCPDGEVLLAGAIVATGNQRGCGPLACEGGVAGLCNHYKSHWAHQKVRAAVCIEVCAG